MKSVGASRLLLKTGNLNILNVFKRSHSLVLCVRKTYLSTTPLQRDDDDGMSKAMMRFEPSLDLSEDDMKTHKVTGTVEVSSTTFTDGEANEESQINGFDLSPEFIYARNRLGMTTLPSAIYQVILLLDYSKETLKSDCERMLQYIRSIHPKGPNSNDSELKSLYTKKLPEEHENRLSLEYGDRDAIAYLAIQSSYNYAATFKVLHEVSKRLHPYVPRSMLDFGTGPGTSIWAAQAIWEGQLQQIVAIDLSEAMLELAEKILSMDSTPHSMTSYTFRRYLSFQRKKQSYSVVICAFTLSEMSDPSVRKLTISNLWDSTEDILILIDRGTPEGFKLVLEARNQILALNDLEASNKDKEPSDISRTDSRKTGVNPGKDEIPAAVARVLAPCPHDGPCPMAGSWCHFSQRLQLPSYQMSSLGYKNNIEDQKYSYIVLKKEPRLSEPLNKGTEASANDEEEMLKASYHWNRIIAPPYKRPRNIVLDVCSTQGHLQRITVPKSQGKQIYYDARKSNWGDLWPHPSKGTPIIHKDFSKKGRNQSG